MKEVGGKIHTEDAVCRSCKATIKTGGGTSNLAQHIRRYHPLKHSLLFPSREKKSKSSNSTEPESKDGKVVQVVVNRLEKNGLVVESQFENRFSPPKPAHP